MATIQKRGDKYRVQIRKQGQKPLTQSFTTRKDAQAWAKRVESEIERGIFLDISEAQETTVLEVVERYETEILPSKRSYPVYRFHLKPLKVNLGHLVLSTVKPSHVSQYRDQRLKEVSPATVIKELGLLQRVLTACVKDWGINLPHGNVVSQIRQPKQPQGRDRRLAVGELDKVLSELKRSPTVKAIVQLALETAMRREEITNMEWKDINIKARTLHIPKTKTDTPRTIPLSGKAIEVLSGIPRRIDGKVFDIQPHSITQAFDRACTRAGIEDLRFHDLRHEATSRFFEKGFNLMEVSSITGHKDLRMLKRYTHLKAEDLAARM
jgi:integrase